ncbi:GGDEF domain-containing protein [Propionivibrio limicola]|uniref:GGDEF domain-containing protein n=1 Tax=Propionivibrio limicola TaxID=167645 RepID=UPI001292878F|nr:GGDEF domain-containing protein [Propionivibrio limicola]
MSTPTNPSEIARETLKQLLTRRMPPSPENYRAIYNEIAGLANNEAAGFPERDLKALLQLLPRETPSQQRLARQIEQAIKSENWDELRTTLTDFIKEHSAETDLAWGELIADIIRQWEVKQSGLTPARKRESLDRVLGTSTKNTELLFNRLQNLVRGWSKNEIADDTIETADSPAEQTAPTTPTSSASPSPFSRASEVLPELRDLFAYTLEAVVAVQLADAPELAAQAKNLAAAARGATTVKAVQDLLANIKRLAFRLEFVAEDNAELKGGLLKLLQLMVDNISELVVDDRWLTGQVDIVRDIIAKPLNPRTLNDAEQHLKEVIFKQSQLKQGLMEAKEALKQMLAGFVDHLADFADSTSDFHDKIETCVAKISHADNITQLEDVLADVMNATRAIQLNAQRSRDDLRAAQQRVQEAEQRVNELQAELDKASLLVRHDQLTGALNRRGLEEIFESESARANRRQSPLCVALLDIDNFKKLNDTLGHDAGDAALIHLVTVIRDTLRPQDTVARFGGEEFVILLPDTPLENANTALVRLQRELTKRYFLNNNEKLLITFSAGLTEFGPDDSFASVTKRADEAMYSAKKTGKNRVVCG